MHLVIQLVILFIAIFSIPTIGIDTIYYIAFNEGLESDNYIDFIICMHEPNTFIQNFFYNANITKWC